MAFVLCPECGAPNSDLSIACPNCGFPIGYVTPRTQLKRLDTNTSPDCESLPSNDEDCEDWPNLPLDPAWLIVNAHNLPVGVYEQLCENSDIDIRRTVAGNPSLPKHLLASLANDTDFVIRMRVASNPTTGIETLASLLNGAEAAGPYDENRRILYALAGNPSLDGTLINRLSASGDVCAQAKIATRLDADKDVLAYLAKMPYYEIELSPYGLISIRSLVAHNPSTGIETLKVLARDEADGVRESVASNPSATEDILTLLAQDNSLLVRREVARNPSSTLVVFQTLNPKTNEDLCYWDQANKNARDELDGIANNPAVDAEMLQSFSKDANSSFRIIAAKHRLTTNETLLNLAHDKETCVRKALASRGAIPLAAAKIVSKDADPIVRAAYASSSSPFLELLLEDTDKNVRKSLASNRTASWRVLAQLAKSCDADVKLELARNSSCPKDLLEQLSFSANENIRKAVAANQSTSEHTLNELSRDKSEEVREAVAGNKSTSVWALEELSRDESLKVRKAIASRNDYRIGTIFERLAFGEGNTKEILRAIFFNSSVSEELKMDMLEEYDYLTFYDVDDDYIPGPPWDESPLDGWHYDEDNGWLDYYPEGD